MTFARLPLEIFERIIDSVEGFPIPWETALDIRELLMEERSVVNEDVGEGYKVSWTAVSISSFLTGLGNI